ncbi:MAG: hypothetical protein Q4C12_08740 [Clostridia bacterium]|nr:hypothetical protein [Clostridia bacterium]
MRQREKTISAYKQGANISPAFTNALDCVTLASDEDEQFETVDRKYWKSKSAAKVLKAV